MKILTVRNVSDEVYRALRVRAAKHGHSVEAKMREILESAVTPGERGGLGSLLANIGRQAKLTNTEFKAFERARDRIQPRPVSFE